MASKFYAVKKGKIPGIYNSWDDCKKMVDGFPGAVYKSFKTLEEAETFVGAEAAPESGAKSRKTRYREAGTKSGSLRLCRRFLQHCHQSLRLRGFLIHNGEKEVLQGSGNDAEMASMRNVSGEILGAMAQ